MAPISFALFTAGASASQQRIPCPEGSHHQMEASRHRVDCGHRSTPRAYPTSSATRPASARYGSSSTFDAAFPDCALPYQCVGQAFSGRPISRLPSDLSPHAVAIPDLAAGTTRIQSAVRYHPLAVVVCHIGRRACRCRSRRSCTKGPGHQYACHDQPASWYARRDRPAPSPPSPNPLGAFGVIGAPVGSLASITTGGERLVSC